MSVFIALTFLFNAYFSMSTVYANNISVLLQNGGNPEYNISVSSTGPLFSDRISEPGNYYPRSGDAPSTITIKNTSNVEARIEAKIEIVYAEWRDQSGATQSASGPDIFIPDAVLLSSVAMLKIVDDGATVYSGAIDALHIASNAGTANGYVSLGSLSPGETNVFDFSVSLPGKLIGNEYQHAKLIFETFIRASFNDITPPPSTPPTTRSPGIVTEDTTPTPTPSQIVTATPTPTPTPTPEILTLPSNTDPVSVVTVSPVPTEDDFRILPSKAPDPAGVIKVNPPTWRAVSYSFPVTVFIFLGIALVSYARKTVSERLKKSASFDETGNDGHDK